VTRFAGLPAITVARAAGAVAVVAFTLSILLVGNVARADPGGDYPALLEQGEQALRRNEAGPALRAYERAAALRHEAVAEWGLVRSWMLAGEYRRALAFSAHAAGAHPNVVEGAGLYAWLLYIGGQPGLARQTLDDAALRVPGHAALDATAARLRSPAVRPDAQLMEGATRQGPHASVELPAAARAMANGVLLPDGRHALVPSGAVAQAQRVWLRDARGRTVGAQWRRDVPALGLAEMAFDAPLQDASPAWLTTARDAFPGSPHMVVGFAATAGTEPVAAWPLLQAGFLGRWLVGQRFALGIEPAGDTAGGAPVFDRSGRLVGLVAREGDESAQLLAASALRAAWPESFAVEAPGGTPPPTLSPDAVYERAMGQVLQVLVLPPDLAMR
jgi:hypothetical protein